MSLKTPTIARMSFLRVKIFLINFIRWQIDLISERCKVYNTRGKRRNDVGDAKDTATKPAKPSRTGLVMISDPPTTVNILDLDHLGGCRLIRLLECLWSVREALPISAVIEVHVKRLSTGRVSLQVLDSLCVYKVLWLEQNRSRRQKRQSWG